MTKPVTRPLRKTGRKRKLAPATVPTAAFIEALAADGRNVIGIAAALGTSKDRLRRWMEEDTELAEAFERGRETERHNLHNKLYRQGMAGLAIASMFLLKARHGYREGDQSDQSNRVAITFNLPGAQPLDKFLEHEPANANLPLPAKSAVRTGRD